MFLQMYGCGPTLRLQKSAGLTLLELMITLTIVGILASVGVGSYQNFLEESDNEVAIRDIKFIAAQIEDYALDHNGNYPQTLAPLNLGSLVDPWGNNYQYLNIVTAKGNGKKRKDRNLVPINSDFDLYSMGPDGASVSPLTARKSQDDIIRANNGAYVGKASEY